MPAKQTARAKGAKSSRRDKPSNKGQAFRTERNARLTKEREARRRQWDKDKWTHTKRTPRGAARAKRRVHYEKAA